MSEVEAAGPRRDRGAYAALIGMVIIGSSTATAAKFALRELPVGLIPLIRFGGAGLCLLPWALARGDWRAMVRADGRRLLAAAALCVPINQAFFLSGARLAPTTHVGLIYAACPLVVLALAVALGQERLAAGRLAGVVMSVLGVVVIGLGNLWDWGPETADALRGDLLIVGAVASWGAYLTVNKPLVERHGAVKALAGTFLLGVLLDLPIAALMIDDWAAARSASLAACGAMAHLTLVVSVVGLACQNLALRRLDASQVATVGNAAPLLTVLWGGLLLGESVTPALALGGALTLGGILRAGRPAASRQKPGDRSQETEVRRQEVGAGGDYRPFGYSSPNSGPEGRRQVPAPSIAS